jgi:hypothetical protein
MASASPPPSGPPSEPPLEPEPSGPVMPAKTYVGKIRIRTLIFASVGTAFRHIDLLNSEQRYQALLEVTRQLQIEATAIDEWFKVIYTEVEKLKRDTED